MKKTTQNATPQLEENILEVQVILTLAREIPNLVKLVDFVQGAC
jgi:hypothetical protein